MKKIFSLFMLFTPLSSFAQIDDLKFHFFGVNNGLSQGNVTCIMQDHLGLMWFGTINGLNVYDGIQNTVYKEKLKRKDGLQGERILGLIEINSNEIAIGTRAGLNIFYRNQDSFALFTTKNVNRAVDLIKKEKNRLLLIQNDELTSFDLQTKQFTPIKNKLARQLHEIFQNSSSGSHHSEYLTRRLYEILTNPLIGYEKIKSIFVRNEVNDILFDSAKGNLYVAASRGLLCYDMASSKQEKSMLLGSMKCLGQDENTIFVGTKDSGLYVYSIPSNKFIAHYLANESNSRSISGNYIRTVFVDRQQNLWASVLGSGVNYGKLLPEISHTILSLHNSSLSVKTRPYIQAMTEDNNNQLWVADVSGNILVLDSAYKLLRLFKPEDIDPVRKPFSIQQIYVNTKNEVFLLTEDGLYVTANHTDFRNVGNSDQAISKSSMYYMAPWNDSVFFLSTRKGLFKFNSRSESISTKDTLLAKQQRKKYIYNDWLGNTYMSQGVQGIGIFRYNGTVLSPVRYINLKLQLNDSYEEKDTIWFATSQGILAVNKYSFSYDLLDEENGLTNQFICTITPDPTEQHTFWCSSHKGIFKYNTKTRHSFALGLNDGLSTLEFNTNSFAKRKNGDLVFGGIDGITWMNPAHIKQGPNPNELVTFNFKLNNKFPNKSNLTSKNNQLTIPYKFNSVSFRLMQVNFPASEVQIKYKLDGLEEEWNTVNNPIDIHYPNLREGTYRFVARYYNRNLGWIEKSFYTITIQAPWYRTWLAYTFYFLCVVAISWMIGRNSIRRQLKQQQEAIAKQHMLIDERNRISADLHDDIGSTLGSIAIYGDLLHEHFDSKPVQSKQMLEKIRSYTRQLMNSIDETIWSLKSNDIEAISLLEKVLAAGSDLLSANQISFNIDIAEGIEELPLNTTAKKYILLIIKEAMNNIAKYSQASTCNVKIYIEHKNLVVSIYDNGGGYDTKTMVKGNGLHNIEDRCLKLEGIAMFDSTKGQGSIVQCSFPLSTIRYVQLK